MRTLEIVTSTLIVAIMAVACSDSSATSPEPLASETLAGLGGPNATPSTSTGILVDFPGSEPDGVGGNADVGTLSRTAQDIAFEITATDLVPGHAYSMWWIVFEKPQFCEDGCNGPDLANRLVRGSVFNGGGAEANWKGEATFADAVPRHDTGDRFVVTGGGIKNTLKAEIHLVIKSHGEAEADPADLLLQTTTPGAFCNLPVGPAQGPPGCKDVGAVVFPIP